MSAKDAFPKRLKALREAIGVSQDEFAKAIGVSRASISYYETKQRTPDIEVLDKIAEETGCSISYLMGLSPNMSESHDLLGWECGISDLAIQHLRDSNSEVTNYFIEHGAFVQLMRTLELYASYIFPEHSMDLYTDKKGYVKYLLLRIFERITNDYDMEHASTPEGRESSAFYFLFPPKEKMMQDLHDIDEQVAAYREAESRINEDEKKDDPISRFRQRMNAMRYEDSDDNDDEQ